MQKIILGLGINRTYHSADSEVTESFSDIFDAMFTRSVKCTTSLCDSVLITFVFYNPY